MSISDILKQRRKDLDITLLDVAKKVGVSEATVQRWESGNIKNLRHERISLLANVLEIPPARLMGWSEAEENTKLATKSDSELLELLKDPLLLEIARKYAKLSPKARNGAQQQLDLLLELEKEAGEDK